MGLIAALRHPNGIVRMWAASYLRGQSPEVTQALCRALDNDPWWVVQVSAATSLCLPGTGTAEAAPSLARALQHERRLVRHATLGALIRFADRASLPAVCTALETALQTARRDPRADGESDQDYRRNLVRLLDRIGDGSAVPVLCAALSDWTVDTDAAMAISRMAREDPCGELAGALEPLRWKVARGGGKYSKQALADVERAIGAVGTNLPIPTEAPLDCRDSLPIPGDASDAR